LHSAKDTTRTSYQVTLAVQSAKIGKTVFENFIGVTIGALGTAMYLTFSFVGNIELAKL